jgi:hypothetical protein
MKKARITLLLVLAWTLLLVSSAIAIEVTAVGFGSDRQSAIDDAKRSAIARVLGEYVDSRTLVENFALVSDRILTSSSGYVRSYEVENTEKYPNGEFRVQINANVEREVLAEDVDAIRVISMRRGDPRFVVIPEPSMRRLNLESSIIEATGAGIEQALSEKGYSILQSPNHNIERDFTDPGMHADLSKYAAGVGAEYVIYFKTTSVDESSGRVFTRSSALVELTVVHTGSYRLITSTSSRGAGGDQHEEFAFREACRTAGYNAATDAMRIVLTDWNRSGSVNGNVLTLEVEGVPAEEDMAFEEALRMTGAVKQVQLSTKDASSSVYQVTLDGSTYELGNAFEQVARDRSWQVWLDAASRSGLTYRVVYD